MSSTSPSCPPYHQAPPRRSGVYGGYCLATFLLGSVLPLVASCGQDRFHEPDPGAFTTGQPVVYGEDDRMDYYAHPDEQLQAITRDSIVALIRPSSLDMSDPADIQIVAPTLGQAYDLCPDQRFYTQPTAADCSGTLIDRDLVLTAGHCVETLSECRRYRYVFDYYYEEGGVLATISLDDLYQCYQVVARQYTSTLDFAVVQLDREVTGRQPATVQLDDVALSPGSTVPIIGFGSGLPAKIDDGGMVLDGRPSSRDYFTNTVDAFGGNSGSGVFNESFEVVGILVRGVTDYLWRNGCFVVNELPADGGGRGEEATYVARAIEEVCQDQQWPSARLCGGPTGDGWCDRCESEADCPAGWSCSQWPDVNDLSYCTKPCIEEQDCVEGHHCSEAGLCQPDLEYRCYWDDVYAFDTCLNRLWLADDCTDGAHCYEGSCLEELPGDVCSSAIELEAIDQVIQGDLGLGYGSEYQGTCGGYGPELVYRFSLDRANELVVLATGFDTVLHLRTVCESSRTQIACNEDSYPPGGGGSRLSVRLYPGTYFLFMDSYNVETGRFVLSLDFEVDCLDQCTEGATQCLGDALQVCVEGLSGCTEWGPAEPCPPGTICEAGSCIPGCRDACIEGERECVGDSGYRQCQVGAQGCTEWGPADTCAETEVCQEGDCVPVCLDDCLVGERECAGDGYRECQVGALGCAEWGAVVSCSKTESCQNGQCVPVCRDDCLVGERECVGDGYRQCQVGALGCTEWGPEEPCSDAEVCQLGICVPACTDVCVQGDRRCDGSGYNTCETAEDGCTRWGGFLPCPPGQTCQSGECVPSCLDECVEGTRRCFSETAYQVCITGDDTCTHWTAPVQCAADERCDSGRCVPLCTDACQPRQRRCAGVSGYRRCGEFDTDPCLDWSGVFPCGDHQVCLDGGLCVIQCPDDGFEPNNRASEASWVEPDVVSDLAVCWNDPDWYRGFLATGDRLTVTVGRVGGDGDLELDLFDREGTRLLAASTETAEDSDRMAYTAEQDQEVVWTVFLHSGAMAEYWMSTAVEPTVPDPCVPGERRCTQDGLGYQICEESPEGGGYRWSEVTDCEPGSLCLVDGICVPMDDVPADQGADAGDLLTDPGAEIPAEEHREGGDERRDPAENIDQDGCSCSSAKSHQVQWLVLLWGIGLLGGMVRRRRTIPGHPERCHSIPTTHLRHVHPVDHDPGA